MLYDPANKEPLRAWLVKTLEPICDAEPGALADYVLALLAHDAPEQELRGEFVSQLEEFFETGAAEFIDTLFAALRTKSYLPYSSTPDVYTAPEAQAPDTGIPIPLDGLLTTTTTETVSPDRRRKRSVDLDEGDRRRPPKGSRLGADGDWRRGVRGSGWDNSATNGVEVNNHTGFNNGDRNQNKGSLLSRISLPRGVCRDYHMKGYCSRGAMCKYSHDSDAFVPGNMPFPAAMPGPPPMFGPFMPFMGNGMAYAMGQGPSGSNVPYDPNQAHMDLGRNVTPGTHGELPVIQDLTPVTGHDVGMAVGATNMQMGLVDGMTPLPQVGAHMSTFGQGIARPVRGGHPRGRGRPLNGEQFNNRPDSNRDNDTIVVRNIPSEHLSLEAVNNYFKKYGTVTKVAVDVQSTQALVTFARHEEAEQAWKSQEAIFNNRFVKIFWHKPMEGQGAVGSRALEASAPAVANFTSVPSKSAASFVNVPKSAVSPLKAPTSAAISSLAAKQQLLDKQIAEQKELFARFSTANAIEKKEIMARLRALDEEMKSASAASPASIPATAPVSVPASATAREQKARALLDAELDSHRAHQTEGSKAEGEGGETAEQLQERLEKLRAEAAALGIHDPSHPSSTYRPYRARGRGRGSYRGLAPPRSYVRMSLDNRPKALMLKGVRTQDADVQNAVRAWYQTDGQFEALEVHADDSLIAKFKSRTGAEQALAKGLNIPSVGQVKISWHTDTVRSGVTDAVGSHSSSLSTTGNEGQEHSPAAGESEEVGWEDGMGAF